MVGEPNFFLNKSLLLTIICVLWENEKKNLSIKSVIFFAPCTIGNFYERSRSSLLDLNTPLQFLEFYFFWN